MTDLEMARALGREVRRHGGRACYVGGCVRDGLLGKPGKDIDMEIHGIPEPELQQILEDLGQPLSMGASFGIWSLRGFGLDIALPRGADRSRPDPFVGLREAARRRDLTCNALMQDVCTGELLDFFGGRADLEAGILRHTDPSTFPEDPLRVLRTAQLAARLNFRVHPDTLALCRRISLGDLPRERVFGEVKKALLKSARPSVFFEVLRSMDQLELWFPELKALIGVPQPPRFHGEGDVWNHTMLVLDAAAPLARYARDPLGFLLGALTHDLGKVSATRETDTGIHAYGHEEAGLPLAERFLRRLTDQRDLFPYVLNLVKLHMRPNALAAQHSGLKATCRLFDEALDPRALLCLAAADDLGRITEVPHVSHEDWFRQRLAIFEERNSQPQVTGRDLMEAGILPGPEFGSYLSYAHRLSLSGLSREAALKQTLQYIRDLQKP